MSITNISAIDISTTVSQANLLREYRAAYQGYNLRYSLVIRQANLQVYPVICRAAGISQLLNAPVNASSVSAPINV
jgi:hypothetical protein